MENPDKKSYNLLIGIDDIHPEDNWGLTDDEQFKYIQALHDEFGVKFTLFVPANFHGRCPISEHLDWFNELENLGYFEFAAHGYLHNTSNRQKYGECECLEISTYQEAEELFKRILAEWDDLPAPTGWKHPGWMASDPVCFYAEKYFAWAAINPKHDNYSWKIPTVDTFTGINDKIHVLGESENIILQSHIAGDWNKNVWNYTNYNNLRTQLVDLFEKYDITNKTFSEMIYS